MSYDYEIYESTTILRRQFSVDYSPPTIHRRKIHRRKIHRRKIHRRKIHRRKIYRRKIHRRKIHRRTIHRRKIRRRKIHRIDLSRSYVEKRRVSFMYFIVDKRILLLSAKFMVWCPYRYTGVIGFLDDSGCIFVKFLLHSSLTLSSEIRT